MNVVCDVDIARQPETIFPWLAEPEKAMQWQQDVVSGSIVVSTPEIVGTTFTEVIEEDGKRLEMHGTITRHVLNKSIAFHLNSKMHEFDVQYSLEEHDTVTKVLIEAVIRWKFPMNVISLFLAKRIQSKLTTQLASELVTLKQLCEA